MSYQNNANSMVQNFIIQQIERGEWPENTRIWSESDLCEHFAVSRVAVRDAIAPLVSMRILGKRKGSGTYVLPASERTIEGQQLFMPSIQEIIDLTELRKTLDVRSVELFIQRASPEDYQALEDCYNHMLASVDHEDDFNKYDTMFHTIINEGTHNGYFMAVSQQLTNPIRMTRPIMHCYTGDSLAIKYHKLILEAIQAHQTKLACAYMELHIDLSLQNYLAHHQKQEGEITHAHC